MFVENADSSKWKCFVETFVLTTFHQAVILVHMVGALSFQLCCSHPTVASCMLVKWLRIFGCGSVVIFSLFLGVSIQVDLSISNVTVKCYSTSVITCKLWFCFIDDGKT